MSNTRTAQSGSALRQERWASSPNLERSLKANLVARRCSTLKSTSFQDVAWFLQYLSLKPGALRQAADSLAVSETTLAEFCLNPQADIPNLVPQLKNLRQAYIKEHTAGVAVTEIGRLIQDGLEYCQASRRLTVICGTARTGKTFAAENFCEQNPGRARYCQVPSTADDLAFFMAIAHALGITIESNAKAKNLRPRIEAALQNGGLQLILDDAQYCWPGHNYRLARPSRICWLITSLINCNVPVALIVTPDFLQIQTSYEKKSGWASAQFVGRIGRFISLPPKLNIEDLEKVARAFLPVGDRRSIEALADYANLSVKHLAAIEHAVAYAKYLANKAGQDAPLWEDIRRAIKENTIPSDSGLAAMLNGS